MTGNPRAISRSSSTSKTRRDAVGWLSSAIVGMWGFPLLVPGWSLSLALGLVACLAAGLMVAARRAARDAHDARETRDAALARQAALEARVSALMQQTDAQAAVETALRRELHTLTTQSAALHARLDVLDEQAAGFARARDEALAGARAKGTILATVSHELRTPLNGVLGLTDLLLQTDLTADQRDLASTVRLSGETLLTLVNDILDLSKVEAGKLSIDRVAFDLQAALEDVLELVAPRAYAKRLELSGFIDARVPTMVLGDPTRVRQVLLNLLGNAVKFTGGGEVVLTASIETERPNDLLVRFSVRDTGIGISPAQQKQLFQPFSQAEGSGRLYGGTGLGLAISKQLAELMGGTIGVSSDPDHGSTFWFTVRLGRISGVASIETGTPVPARARLLIVEDHDTTIELVSMLFAERGLAVAWAQTAERALRMREHARTEGTPFDAIVIDPTLPDMPGHALAEHLAGLDPALPRLLLASPHVRQLWPEPRAGLYTHVLAKPVRRSLVGAAVEAIMSREAPPQAAAAPPPAAMPRFSLSVLLVEDNAVNRKVATLMLRNLGIDADVAVNGREAVEAVTARPYDLVLMDCQMPEMDGFEATRGIRALEGPRSSVPIVALTANAMESDREACMAAGMNDFLTKPIRSEALQDAILRWHGQLAA